MKRREFDRFDRARCVTELRGVLKGDDRWYSQTGSNYIAAGRNDGSATVVAAERGWKPAAVPEESDGAGELRWLLLHHVGDVLAEDVHPDAAAAVAAANALSESVVT